MVRDDLFNFIGRSALVATVDDANLCVQIAFDPSAHAGTQLRRGAHGAEITPASSSVNKALISPQNERDEANAHSAKLAEEAALVARARSRDRQAYQTLVERYQGRLMAAAIDIVHSRADAEDIVQNAFVKAYMSLASFEGKSSFFTWLYRIVHNLAIDERRRRARQGGEAVDIESLLGNELANRIAVDGPFDRVLQQQQAQAISKVLAMISDDHRSVILLREVDGLSYDEISQALNISRGTVMSRLHYARKKLQQLLKEFAPNSAVSETILDIDKSGDSYEHSIKQRA